MGLTAKRRWLIGGLVATTCITIIIWAFVFSDSLSLFPSSKPLYHLPRPLSIDKLPIICGRNSPKSWGERWCVHKRFYAILQRYKQFHAHTLASSSPRLLIVEQFPASGTGNRLSHLLSAFLMALLTQRALVLDWQEVSKMKWLTEEMAQVDFEHLFDVPDMEISWKKVKAKLVSRGTNLGNIRKVGDSVKEKNTLRCANLNELFPEAIVSIVATSWWAPLLETNPFYQRIVRRWFGRRALYRELFHALLQPSAAVWALLGGKNATLPSCSVLVQIRQKAAALPRQKIGPFVDCVRAVRDSREPVGVVSDDSETKEKVKEGVGASSTLSFEYKDHCREGALCHQQAVFEILYFSACKKCVITYGSTFSSASCAIAGVTPHVVGSQLSASSQCMLLDSSDPIDAGQIEPNDPYTLRKTINTPFAELCKNTPASQHKFHTAAVVTAFMNGRSFKILVDEVQSATQGLPMYMPVIVFSDVDMLGLSLRSALGGGRAMVFINTNITRAWLLHPILQDYDRIIRVQTGGGSIDQSQIDSHAAVFSKQTQELPKCVLSPLMPHLRWQIGAVGDGKYVYDSANQQFSLRTPTLQNYALDTRLLRVYKRYKFDAVLRSLKGMKCKVDREAFVVYVVMLMAQAGRENVLVR